MGSEWLTHGLSVIFYSDFLVKKNGGFYKWVIFIMSHGGFLMGRPFFHQQSGIFHEIDNPAIGLASFQETSIWEHMI